MIWIDYKDATPIYEQIVSRFKNLIVRGALKPDEKMPSVRTLAMELSINPNTIQKAYMQLEQQGFIYTVKGRGNFVTGDRGLKDIKQSEIEEKLSLLIDEVHDAGMQIDDMIAYLERRKKEESNKKEGDNV